MSSTADFNSVVAVGVTVTTGVASAAVALPVAASGAAPKYVLVQANGFAFIKFGASTVTATTNDIYVSPNEARRFSTGGCTHFAHIQDVGAQKVNVVPVEG